MSVARSFFFRSFELEGYLIKSVKNFFFKRAEVTVKGVKIKVYTPKSAKNANMSHSDWSIHEL